MNPVLKETRKKIVVLQDFDSDLSFGLSYESFRIQDRFMLTNRLDLYTKWVYVKQHFLSTISTSKSLINYLSGTGFCGIGVCAPYFVASGHINLRTNAPNMNTGVSANEKAYPDFPRQNCLINNTCLIYFQGTNVLANNLIDAQVHKFENLNIFLFFMNFSHYSF